MAVTVQVVFMILFFALAETINITGEDLTGKIESGRFSLSPQTYRFLSRRSIRFFGVSIGHVLDWKLSRSPSPLYLTLNQSDSYLSVPDRHRKIPVSCLWGTCFSRPLEAFLDQSQQHGVADRFNSTARWIRNAMISSRGIPNPVWQE